MFLETAVPQKPQNLRLLKGGETSIEVAWNPVKNSEQYLVQICPMGIIAKKKPEVKPETKKNEETTKPTTPTTTTPAALVAPVTPVTSAAVTAPSATLKPAETEASAAPPTKPTETGTEASQKQTETDSKTEKKMEIETGSENNSEEQMDTAPPKDTTPGVKPEVEEKETPTGLKENKPEVTEKNDKEPEVT